LTLADAERTLATMALQIEVTRRRFTVDEYCRMTEAGILTAEDRVELIEGEIVQMAAIGVEHAFAVGAFNRLLGAALGDRAILWPQNPVRLSDSTMPQPDILLLQPPIDRYRMRHPRPEDVLLAIEVADTTHRYDRLVKMPLYARAGIPEAWLADLPGEALEVYRQPSPAGYQRVARIARDGIVGPEVFPDVTVAVEAVLASPPRS
jgi:Uma2 family endonuclease